MVAATWFAGVIMEALSSSGGAQTAATEVPSKTPNGLQLCRGRAVQSISTTASDMDQNSLFYSFQYFTGILNESFAVTCM